MIEVRFHGRGGQGSVTAAELVAQAAIAEGRFAQAFPSFGPERRGAPVTSFLRVSESNIYLREKIETPGVIVVLDSSLIELEDCFHGLKPGGTAVINCSPGYARQLQATFPAVRLVTVDATRIAQEILGLPIANTAMIGALVRGTALVRVESLQIPLRNRFGKLAEANFQSLHRSHKAAERVEASQSPSPGEEVECEFSEIIARQALMDWKSLALGGDIVAPGSSRSFLTGNWRMSGRPVFENEKCHQCGFCWLYCPEDALALSEEGYYVCDEDYCKGCGVCARECPTGALVMEEET